MADHVPEPLPFKPWTKNRRVSPDTARLGPSTVRPSSSEGSLPVHIGPSNRTLHIWRNTLRRGRRTILHLRLRILPWRDAHLRGRPSRLGFTRLRQALDRTAPILPM